MKGTPFRVLLDYADARWGPLAIEEMIDRAGLARGGAYTAVGDYPPEEFEALVSALAGVTGEGHARIYADLGRLTIDRLLLAQSDPVPEEQSVALALASLPRMLRQDTKKLYGDTPLPDFDLRHEQGGWIILDVDCRPFTPDFVEGAIRGLLMRLGKVARIERSESPCAPSKRVRFRVGSES
ncbi:MAG: heme NO-binding domain-containing protein [Pseudomonadota bacterium]